MSVSETQSWNPDQYVENASFVAELGTGVLELLTPVPGMRVLDLGCGDGALTAKLVDFGCDVVGVDASPEMVAAAKTRGLNAHVMDGQALGFSDEFDAVFSNAALHWMKRPASVIAGVHRALKPGGRFVGELGGHGNVFAIVSALEAALSARGLSVESPWYFPRLEEYENLLESGGFLVEKIRLFARPTPLPGDVSGWLETFAQTYTSVLPATERNVFIAEVAEALRPLLSDSNGDWEADYVRLRFSARKPDAAD